MRVTIVQGAFKPVPAVTGGSVEKLWFDLGREFARRGLEVTHFSRRYPGMPDHETIEGVRHRRLGSADHPGGALRAKALDLIYSLRCRAALPPADIVVTNTFFLPVLLTLGPRRALTYVSVHRYPQGQMNLYRRVDRLQCVSTAVADAVRAQAPALAARVKVVPNYVPSLLTDAEVRAAWPERRREVLFVGRIHPEKGIDLLMRAFAAIAPAVRAGWRLRVIGPHDLPAGGYGEAFLESLKQIAAELRLDVDWVGPIFDPEALNAAYRRARMFVYPSTAAKGEAFPLAPLEAMAQGCPVVTSDLVCFDDYVRAGVNAATFPLAVPDVPAALGAALAALMADAERQRQFGIAGLRTAQNFTLERVAGQFIDDFAALLATRRGRPRGQTGGAPGEAR